MTTNDILKEKMIAFEKAHKEFLEAIKNKYPIGKRVKFKIYYSLNTINNGVIIGYTYSTRYRLTPQIKIQSDSGLLVWAVPKEIIEDKEDE